MAARKNNLAKKLSAGKVPAFRTFAVSLSQEVAEAYDAQAGNRDTGALISDRLEDPLVVNHTSEKALYFTDEERRELDLLLEYNFSTARQVLDRLRSLLTVISVKANEESTDLVLTPVHIFRLTERASMAGLSVAEYAKRLGLDGINREIGLY